MARASVPGAAADTFDAPEGLAARLPLVIAAAGVLLVAGFDLTSSLPFNDEFFYQWTVRRLGEGHGLQLFPGQAPIALVQLALGGLAWAVAHDPRAVRLTAIPFVVAALWGIYMLARDLGVSRFYAGVAAAVPVALPVYAAAATGFMSEPFYLGLLLPFCVTATRWLRAGRGGALMVVLAALCALERQHAAAIPPALSVAVLVSAGRRGVSRGDLGWLAAVWVVVGAALLLPGVTGLQTEQMRLNLGSFTSPSASAAAAMLLYLPGMAGIALLAFGGALPWSSGGNPRWWARPLVPALAGLVVLVVLLTFILPGNYFTRAGLNPITVAGSKPELYGVLIPAIGLIGVACLLILVARPAPMFTHLLHDPGAVLLLVVGAGALVPMLNGDVFDRYYLAVDLPWVPLAAMLAGNARWSRVGRAWAMAALLAGVAVYAAGEQDYQAWQQARDQAERLAERSVSPRDIFSGFETYGVRVVLPEYERTGRLGTVTGRRTTTAEAPLHPRAILLITGPNDNRPGVPYHSLASGRVVVQFLPRQPGVAE